MMPSKSDTKLCDLHLTMSSAHLFSQVWFLGGMLGASCWAVGEGTGFNWMHRHLNWTYANNFVFPKPNVEIMPLMVVWLTACRHFQFPPKGPQLNNILMETTISVSKLNVNKTAIFSAKEKNYDLFISTEWRTILKIMFCKFGKFSKQKHNFSIFFIEKYYFLKLSTTTCWVGKHQTKKFLVLVWFF